MGKHTSLVLRMERETAGESRAQDSQRSLLGSAYILLLFVVFADVDLAANW